MKKQPGPPIEQLVLRGLQPGTLPTRQLIQRISARRPKTTKQGVYRVLRKLKAEEKVVVHGKMVSLNLHWIKTRQMFFTLAEYYYSPQAASANGFLNIREKDKIVYSFKNLQLLDSFWSHAFYLFAQSLPSRVPIFVYNPHQWFSYARQETETMLIKTMREKRRQILITVAYQNTLNQHLKKKFTGDLTQYMITNRLLFNKSNYYLNIFGDVLIEVLIDNSIAGKIHQLFSQAKVFDDQAKSKLTQIVAQDGRNTLVISRNMEKAEKYKKSLAKSFYLMRLC